MADIEALKITIDEMDLKIQELMVVRNMINVEIDEWKAKKKLAKAAIAAQKVVLKQQELKEHGVKRSMAGVAIGEAGKSTRERSESS